VGDSILISDRANQKDTAAGDRVYLARRHDGGSVTRCKAHDGPRTCGVEGANTDRRGGDGQIRSTTATRQICLPPWQHKVGAGGWAWPPPQQGTGRGKIHLPPCDKDQEGVDGDSQR